MRGSFLGPRGLKWKQLKKGRKGGGERAKTECNMFSWQQRYTLLAQVCIAKSLELHAGTGEQWMS